MGMLCVQVTQKNDTTLWFQQQMQPGTKYILNILYILLCTSFFDFISHYHSFHKTSLLSIRHLCDPSS